ncbi:MAG: fetC [Peptococcaceae bacterium]|jgi:iron(III) transport system permease protein|nr:fetC [Peptococcaceae bacterium]
MATKTKRALSALLTYWNNRWHKPPSFSFALLGFIISLMMALPLSYVILRALGSDKAVWHRLFSTRIPQLLWNTLSLTLVVSLLTLFIGVTLAFLVERTNLMGSKIWRWLLVLPLVIPPYIGTFSYITLFGNTGILKNQYINIYSFPGVAFIMTLYTFPYVFLLVSAALQRINPHYEEAARLAGLKPPQIFLRVILPLLRPSMGAGSILAALYVFSDFGAVGMLRYFTFTSAIYTQLIGRYDRSGAAVLSLVLIFLTFVLLFWEWYTKRNKAYYQSKGILKKQEPINLHYWRIPALILAGSVFLLAVALPVGTLVYWLILGLFKQITFSEFWKYTFNSFLVSSLAATASLIFASIIGILHKRNGGFFGELMARCCFAGYALPGVIIAIGILFFANSYLPWIYGTFLMLVIAYIIRFMPQGLQSFEASLVFISPNLEDAARSLGEGPWGVLRRVIFPLTLPGLKAGWTLMFISSLKELPVTLLLRPAGFDTLSVRIWLEASEGFYIAAAPAALLLILVSIIPIRLIAGRDGGYKNEGVS